MTKEEFNEIVNNQMYACSSMLINKRKEYASDYNVFANFDKAVGLSFHDSSEKVLWGYMVKHLQSIKDIVEHVSVDGCNGYPTQIILDEKFTDSINYLIILKAMIEDKLIKYEKGNNIK